MSVSFTADAIAAGEVARIGSGVGEPPRRHNFARVGSGGLDAAERRAAAPRTARSSVVGRVVVANGGL